MPVWSRMQKSVLALTCAMCMSAGEQRLDNLLKRDLFCKLRDGDGIPEKVRRHMLMRYSVNLVPNKHCRSSYV